MEWNSGVVECPADDPVLFPLIAHVLFVELGYRQEYIIGRERESILLHILLCKCIADN